MEMSVSLFSGVYNELFILSWAAFFFLSSGFPKHSSPIFLSFFCDPLLGVFVFCGCFQLTHKGDSYFWLLFTAEPFLLAWVLEICYMNNGS